MSQTIESVEVFDRKDGQVRELCPEACGFTYRSSIFNTTERGRFIILRVTYALTPGGEAYIEYADLKRHFEGRETRPNLAETREAVRHIRARKGMLITPGDPDCQSAGSFFKNPVLSEEQHEDLQKRAEAKGLILPSYPALEKSHKVSAAWLVEKSGFARGYGFGRVGISEQTCAGHRESRRRHCRRSPRPERSNPASRRRTLGREVGARTGDGRLLGLVARAPLPVRLAGSAKRLNPSASFLFAS